MRYISSYKIFEGSLNGLMAMHQLNNGIPLKFTEEEHKRLSEFSQRIKSNWVLNIDKKHSFSMIPSDIPSDISLKDNPIGMRIWKFKDHNGDVYFIKLTARLNPAEYGSFYIDENFAEWARSWNKYKTSNIEDVFKSED